MTISHRINLVATATCGLLFSVSSSVYAQTTVTARASANATVQAAGPRTGTSGTNFFNIEGSNNGTGYVAGTTPGAFASFGVLDFTAASFGITGTVTDVMSLNLLLRDAPASFSSATSVPINFYLATDTTTSISNAGTQGSSSPLRFTGAGEGIVSGGQLGTFYALGSGTYAKSAGNGTAFNYALTLSSTAGKNLFINALNSAGAIRVVVTPGTPDSNLAATFGGATNTTAGLTDAPALSFQVTTSTPNNAPEAGSAWLLLTAVPVLGFVLVRRRK